MVEVLLVGGLALVLALCVADAVAPRKRPSVTDVRAQPWAFACVWAGV
jgi:hypothetical protein